jgi:hypothetical protein
VNTEIVTLLRAGMFRLLQAAVLAACLCGVSPAADQETRAAKCKEFQKRLYDLVRGRDLPAIEKLAAEAHGRWAEEDPELHARLVLQVSQILSTAKFGGGRQRGLSQTLAAGALQTADRIDLETEWRLVHLYDRPIDENGEELEGEAWARLRADQARWWLHAWGRLRKEIDPNWDFEQGPRRPGPREVEEVGEEEAHRRWQAAVLEHSRQRRLWRLLEHDVPEAERYVIHIYRKPPPALEELRGLLTKHLPDDKRIRERILKAVNAVESGRGNRKRKPGSRSDPRDE